MKLEVGKYYIRRDGETTDALVSYSMWDYKFRDPKFDEIYLEDGRDWDDSERPCDLIAEAPIDDKDVRIQELINSIDDLGFYVGDLERERDTLKARVSELEIVANYATNMLPLVEKERDLLKDRAGELSKMWDESFKHANKLADDKDILKAKIEELEGVSEMRRQSICFTMKERDTFQYLWNIESKAHSRSLDERDTLRKAHDDQVDKVLELGAECDELRTQVSDITSMWTAACEANKALMVRVEELQFHCDQNLGAALAFEKERDTLRTQLEGEYRLRDTRSEMLIDLRTQLEAAQAAHQLTRAVNEQLNEVRQHLETKLADATRKGELLCVEVGNLTMELNETHETAQELQEREHTLKACCRSYQLKIDSLEAKLAQLEAQNSLRSSEILRQNLQGLMKERDEMRSELHEERKVIADLQAKLAKYEDAYGEMPPEQPKVVKQTWQAVYNDDVDSHGKKRATRELCLAKAIKDDTLMCLMRVDHYSDGKVVAVLESVGG